MLKPRAVTRLALASKPHNFPLQSLGPPLAHYERSTSTKVWLLNQVLPRPILFENALAFRVTLAAHDANKTPYSLHDSPPLSVHATFLGPAVANALAQLTRVAMRWMHSDSDAVSVAFCRTRHVDVRGAWWLRPQKATRQQDAGSRELIPPARPARSLPRLTGGYLLAGSA